MQSLCHSCNHHFKVSAAMIRKSGDPTVNTSLTVSICLICKERNAILSSSLPSNYVIQKDDNTAVITECTHYDKKTK